MRTYEVITTETIEVADDVTDTDIYRALNNEGRDRWLSERSISREDHVQESAW